MAELRAFIRNVQDFPQKGIGFKDITTLLKNGGAFREAVDDIYNQFRNAEIDKVVGTESRGFIFGSVLAYKWGAGFVPVRKPGKLPALAIKEEYELEYGTDALEIHKDAISNGENVLIVDDLLATGGTAAATSKLVENLGGKIIAVAFLIELTFLNGRDKLKGQTIYSSIKYDAE